ncbi:(2Fe-2S)-binding protein [Saccharopolyspora sp. K220]|uniref:(2Fe-2S)-binding protein n=1 Tax=Saccharopolyspora soli TaxID=2926618 RepID=UPI001F59B663|nr:(2Fe-2S)-binding protein [Saccharopolyspora soli]MCI2423640.1 (2Fe-2S)-binding protein [Saccharopolyspora soli]
MPKYEFTVNGEDVQVDAPAEMPLLWALRDKLRITGPKYGCGVGVCRACTCLMDDEEVQTCMVQVKDADGTQVTTIEGLADGDELHPVQQAWIDMDVPQCGFCQPGQIMTAVALLNEKSEPTDADIDKIENVCRCGTYGRIRAAVKQAAKNM